MRAAAGAAKAKLREEPSEGEGQGGDADTEAEEEEEDEDDGLRVQHVTVCSQRRAVLCCSAILRASCGEICQ